MAEILKFAQNIAADTAGHDNATRAAGPAFAGIRRNRSLLELEAWLPSEIKAISPLVAQLMRLIEGSRCVAGSEYAVELRILDSGLGRILDKNISSPRVYDVFPAPT